MKSKGIKLMQSEQISIKEPSLSDLLSRATLLSKFAPICFYIFLTITALAVFVPLNPTMPSRGIDPSYAFAMNQAVARHLSFGREIVFTYGPYASICTRTYDPAIDRRMVLGSLLLGVCYVTGVLFLARGQRRYLIVILLLFFATFGSGELFLLSYPLLLVLCVLKQVGSGDSGKATVLSWRQLPVVIVMWSALGLLPVVKGTLLLPFAASVAVSSALLLYRAHFTQALLVLLTPIAASLGFWIIAGQSLADIPGFLRGMASLTSGFTEAMSLPWAILPGIAGDALVGVFLLLSALIFVSVSRSPGLARSSKWALGLVCTVFLLVAFKHGFVVPMNVWTAFASLAVYTLIIGFLHVDKVVVWSLSVAILLTAATSIIRDPVLVEQVHQRFGVGTSWKRGSGRRDVLIFCMQRLAGAASRATYKSVWRTYSRAWKGLSSRATEPDYPESQFVAAKANIRDEYALPALKGTTDFYEYDQSVLLASDNTWNPRPIIQSYSAYTPALASLNEQHLRGRDAPDWVLFDLQTIDGRLPSLDDGLSWPAMLDNYTFVSFNGRFVLMRKNQSVRSRSSYDDVSTKTCKAGATVILPETDGLLFGEVDLKPTLAGQLLTKLFNPPELHVVLGLEDGETRTFRVVSNMMKTDVLLSPLVSDTAEFASLVARNKHLQHEGRVRTISIEPSYGGSAYWSGTYELTLKRYAGE